MSTSHCAQHVGEEEGQTNPRGTETSLRTLTLIGVVYLHRSAAPASSVDVDKTIRILRIATADCAHASERVAVTVDAGHRSIFLFAFGTLDQLSTEAEA